MADDVRRKEVQRCWMCNKEGHMKKECPELSCFYCKGHHLKKNCWKYQIRFLFQQKIKYQELKINNFTLNFIAPQEKVDKKPKKTKPKKKTPEEKRKRWLISMRMKKEAHQKNKQIPLKKEDIKQEMKNIDNENVNLETNHSTAQITQKSKTKSKKKKFQPIEIPNLFKEEKEKTYYDKIQELISPEEINKYETIAKRCYDPNALPDYFYEEYVVDYRLAAANYIKPWTDRNGKRYPSQKNLKDLKNKDKIAAAMAYMKIHPNFLEMQRDLRRLPSSLLD